MLYPKGPRQVQTIARGATLISGVSTLRLSSRPPMVRDRAVSPAGTPPTLDSLAVLSVRVLQCWLALLLSLGGTSTVNQASHCERQTRLPGTQLGPNYIRSSLHHQIQYACAIRSNRVHRNNNSPWPAAQYVTILIITVLFITYTTYCFCLLSFVRHSMFTEAMNVVLGMKMPAGDTTLRCSKCVRSFSASVGFGLTIQDKTEGCLQGYLCHLHVRSMTEELLPHSHHEKSCFCETLSTLHLCKQYACRHLMGFSHDLLIVHAQHLKKRILK